MLSDYVIRTRGDGSKRKQTQTRLLHSDFRLQREHWVGSPVTGVQVQLLLLTSSMSLIKSLLPRALSGLLTPKFKASGFKSKTLQSRGSPTFVSRVSHLRRHPPTDASFKPEADVGFSRHSDTLGASWVPSSLPEPQPHSVSCLKPERKTYPALRDGLRNSNPLLNPNCESLWEQSAS